MTKFVTKELKMKHRKCKSCKKWIAPQTSGRPAIYCSNACRQRAYRKRPKADPILRKFQKLNAERKRGRNQEYAITQNTLQTLGFDQTDIQQYTADVEPAPDIGALCKKLDMGPYQLADFLRVPKKEINRWLNLQAESEAVNPLGPAVVSLLRIANRDPDAVLRALHSNTRETGR